MANAFCIAKSCGEDIIKKSIFAKIFKAKIEICPLYSPIMAPKIDDRCLAMLKKPDVSGSYLLKLREAGEIDHRDSSDSVVTLPDK